MINRKLLSYLRNWATDEDRKPLVMRGARQVGKTTLVNEFAKDYEVYLRLNLDKASDKILFEDYKEINALIDAIYLVNGQLKKDVLAWGLEKSIKIPDILNVNFGKQSLIELFIKDFEN